MISSYRLGQGLPANKLILGIPTYGRAWKLDEESGLTGVPPISTDGPADAGPYTNEAGLLSYPEICNKIATPKEIQAGYLGKLRRVNDPTKRYGKEFVNKIILGRRWGQNIWSISFFLIYRTRI